MIKVKEIKFRRVEGPVTRGNNSIIAKSFIDLQMRILNICHNAPTPGNGYDKCDFSVEWEDGSTYRGRYDLQNTGRNNCGESVWQQILSHWRFYSGNFKPINMSDEQYQNAIKGKQENALNGLKNYSLD